jgi:predicted N-acetyltransferase YhbS
MYTIRNYQPKDAQSIWTLHTVTMAQHNINLPATRYADLQDIPAHYPPQHALFMVAETEDGQLVGMGGARPFAEPDVDKSVVEIAHLRVHPSHQNQQVGANLLADLEAFVTAAGYKLTRLTVLLEQTEVQRFFLQHGYYFVRRDVRDGVAVAWFEKQLGWKRREVK